VGGWAGGGALRGRNHAAQPRAHHPRHHLRAHFQLPSFIALCGPQGLTKQGSAMRLRRAHTPRTHARLDPGTPHGARLRQQGGRGSRRAPPPAVTGLCHSLSAGTASHRETTRTPHNTRCAWRAAKPVPADAMHRHARHARQAGVWSTRRTLPRAPRHTPHHGSSLSASQPYALAWPAPRPRIIGKLTVRTIQAHIAIGQPCRQGAHWVP
jgi:hypothetical protein